MTYITSYRCAVHHYRCKNFPSTEGPVSVRAACYLFELSAYDASLLPLSPWTTVYVNPATVREADPFVWRTAIIRPDLCVEIESESDAQSLSLQHEACNSWTAFVQSVKKSITWMRRIGVHPHILSRMASPYEMRMVEVRTLQDDYLARMAASGNAEIARMAHTLHEYETMVRKNDVMADPCVEFSSFLWNPEWSRIPEWARKKYLQARDEKGFTYLDSTFAPKDDKVEVNFQA